MPWIWLNGFTTNLIGVGLKLFFVERIPFVVRVSSEKLAEHFPKVLCCYFVEASDTKVHHVEKVEARNSKNDAKISGHPVRQPNFRVWWKVEQSRVGSRHSHNERLPRLCILRRLILAGSNQIVIYFDRGGCILLARRHSLE